jgi:hypothetical protein
MESLRAAKAAGVPAIMFTSANFNKYREAEALLTAMVEEQLGLRFFVQCDTQIPRQEQLSGGVMRVRRDVADDYLALRRPTFGCESAPLPRSVALPVAEQLRTPERHFVRADVDRSSPGLRAIFDYDYAKTEPLY